MSLIYCEVCDTYVPVDHSVDAEVPVLACGHTHHESNDDRYRELDFAKEEVRYYGVTI